MRTRGVILLAAVSAAGALVMAGLAASPRQVDPSRTPQPVQAQEAAGVETGPLVAEGAEADLAVLYTGGVVGYVDPCG